VVGIVGFIVWEYFVSGHSTLYSFDFQVVSIYIYMIIG
jgi:hypothetical protein